MENIPYGTYFEASQYYINNERDLNEATAFIDHLSRKVLKFLDIDKSKILFAPGKKKDALEIVTLANKSANNANYTEQTEL